MTELVWPANAYLASYVDALERGWSPDNMRPEAGREELERIRRDPTLFLQQRVDREAAGPPLRCRMAHRFRAFQDIADGCGTGRSAA